MGKKSSSARAAPNPYEAQLAQMASQYYGSTEGMREKQIKLWRQMLTGKLPSILENQFSGLRAPIEDQYRVARENVLASLPKGGALYEGLGDVESARARGLQDLMSNIFMDQINKAYGAAFGAPQVSFGGMGTAAGTFANTQAAQMAANANMYGSRMGALGQLGSAGMQSVCCFNFLEAEGEIYPTVRIYRDEHYPRTGDVARGYHRTAVVLVPLMRRYPAWKWIVRILMTRPLKAYSRWYYGEYRPGFIFWPFKAAWTSAWRMLGWL